jgi:phosphopentomutase
VQQTDLAGHRQDIELYAKYLNTASEGIKEIMQLMSPDDIMVITADHGNDPTVGSKHTREKVPLLVYKKGLHNINIGQRETLADIGATVVDALSENQKLSYGQSFLKKLK